MDPLVWLGIWVTLLAALAGLASVLAGLFSFSTGKDYWPKGMRPRRRRVPASNEDQRTHGLCVMLIGAAVLLLMLTMGMAQLSTWAGIAPEPVKTLRFLLELIGVAASLAVSSVAFRLRNSVRYLDGRTSTAAGPETPTN